MDHYLEIRLLADPEFSPSLLMNALFAKLHRALYDLGTHSIGVSFPGVESAPPRLGETLRLHGTLSDLQSLMALKWLTGMSDHTAVDGPIPIPAKVTYRAVRRVQVKSSPERLRRRYMKRKRVDHETALNDIPDNCAKRVSLPYVQIKSRSTEQTYRVFIEHRETGNEPASGNFSHYGLSATATIPWF